MDDIFVGVVCTELHTEFINEMKDMLGSEFGEFMSCLELPHYRGIHINSLKFDANDAGKLGLPIEKCRFAANGFYLTDDIGVGNSAWHHAGAFYSQEPSAMSAVTVLDPQPGEKILDMCAAPGGKTSQIAAALGDSGLLWSNEYVSKRARILLSNIERMGVRNCVVSNADPERLSNGLSGFFDRVLVDAPCSGEGMFRRNPEAVLEWSPEHSASCAVRQSAILESAAECLRGGGTLVYSTCTFSFCENEDVIIKFLEAHPDFSIVESGVDFGRSGFDRSDKFDLTLSRRIFPMDGGEGHFVAKLKKSGDSTGYSCYAENKKPTDAEKRAQELFRECFSCEPYGKITQIGNSCYLLPEDMPDVRGLGVIRGGVLLGEDARVRIEPSHALFMAARIGECKKIMSFPSDSVELAAFLHGEEIAAEDNIKGYVGVACEDTMTGFGKCSGGRLKNKYPKGLRTL